MTEITSQKPEPSVDKADLRQRAEATLKTKQERSSFVVADLTTAEIEELIHELSVHQIELEMQNDELNQTSNDLETSRAKYFDLFDLAPVGYLTVSKQGLISETNLTAAINFGLPRQDLLQKPFTYFIVPEDQDNHYLHFRKLVNTGAMQSYEVRLRNSDGDANWVHVDAAESRVHESFRLALSNIQVQKEAQIALENNHLELQKALLKLEETQTTLVKKERLAAVGNLAAGIAHDFNNILGVISLQIEMGMWTSDQQLLKGRLQIAQEQVEHAAALVQQILDFGRSTILQKELLDLNELLKHQSSLFLHIIAENIEFELQVSDGECFVEGDKNRFQQMFFNLILNCRDALPDGGHVAIRAENVERSAVKIEHGELPEALHWVQLTIEDNGTGIPLDILPHVFEPFVSTKNKTTNHGLGLSQVYGIVKQHRGEIAIHSQAGVGTEVTIWLPLYVVGAPSNDNIIRETLPLQVGNEEQILIVEDKEEFAVVLADVFESLNYRPLTASNGEEALQIIESTPDIDLIISDMVMPLMGGEALFIELKNRKVQIPMIIISGYTLKSRIIDQLIFDGLAGFLVKPVDIKRLSSTVATVLKQKK